MAGERRLPTFDGVNHSNHAKLVRVRDPTGKIEEIPGKKLIRGLADGIHDCVGRGGSGETPAQTDEHTPLLLSPFEPPESVLAVTCTAFEIGLTRVCLAHGSSQPAMMHELN